mmetsp:Transcript_100489/g.199567  ORF Transcript_100489/g.199567 Transcript_100489/m.199567 type:complete len:106 (-) Transcript_100489:26-343(-)
MLKQLFEVACLQMKSCTLVRTRGLVGRTHGNLWKRITVVDIAMTMPMDMTTANEGSNSHSCMECCHGEHGRSIDTCGCCHDHSSGHDHSFSYTGIKTHSFFVYQC